MSLAAYKLTKNRPESPVWHNGKQYLPSELAKLPKQTATGQSSSLAGLSSHEQIKRLTEARKGKSSTSATPKSNEPSSAVGELLFDENGKCLGWLSYE